MRKKPEIQKAKPITLKEAILYSRNSIVSKTLLDTKAGTLTLFAFDKGQALSEHTAPFDAVVQILDGEALLVIAAKKVAAPCGTLVIMPAHLPHAVKAQKRFKMLLTMIRS